MTAPLLIIGAGGRVGTLLRNIWSHATGGHPVVFQSRVAGAAIDLVCPHMDVPACLGQTPRFSALVMLSGVTYGTADDMAQNARFGRDALELARQLGIMRVILCSSAAVYGAAPDRFVFKETDPTCARRPYGQAKLNLERTAREWVCAQPDAPKVTCLRMANVIGADMLAHAVAHATPSQPLKLDQFPDEQSPRRSYLGVSAFAAVLCAIANGDLSGSCDVLNVANAGVPVPMHSILDALGRQGVSVPWRWQSAPDDAMPVVGLDTAALRQRFPNLAMIHQPATADDLVADWLMARRPGE